MRTEKEDFKYGTYLCNRVYNLYFYIFDKIKIGALINILNMVQRGKTYSNMNLLM